MDPVVRAAVATDEDELARLQGLARDSMVDVRGGALRLAECPVVDDWAATIEADGIMVFVATIGEVLVGYLVLRLAPERNRGVIAHAFVEAGARELGFGDSMVEAAIQTVRAAGLAGIEAVALPGDRETKNLYERAGLTARKITVYKSLG